MTAATDTHSQPAARSGPTWSVEAFARFWEDPDPALVPTALTEDVVGHWPGRDEPTYGREAYTAQIERLLKLLPDLRLEVAEHATDGQIVFIRWIMHATGRHGPFEMTGVDRIRVRDGLVVENIVVFDTARFQALSGHRAGSID